MRSDMSLHDSTDRLHPAIFRAITGFLMIFVASAWGFFAGGYTGWVLAIVTLFALIVTAIPLDLWRIWRNQRATVGRGAAPAPGSFADWLGGEFETWQARMRGTDAAVTLLLPIAAAACGEIAFSVVFQIVSPGG